MQVKYETVAEIYRVRFAEMNHQLIMRDAALAEKDAEIQALKDELAKFRSEAALAEPAPKGPTIVSGDIVKN